MERAAPRSPPRRGSGPTHATSASAADRGVNVQVAVRCRPPSERERAEAHFNIVQCDEHARQVTTPGAQSVVRKAAAATGKKTYNFDVVFPPTATQKQLYDSICAPIVDDVLQGFNCTVFAYGQTGTGKTHTMEGWRRNDGQDVYQARDEHSIGMIPRAVQHIFRALRRGGDEYSVRVSHLELYNEAITDLLGSAEDTDKLRIYENEQNGTFVSGLMDLTVEDEDEVFAVLERSARRRITAETELNKFSSRSHTIFTVSIHSKATSAANGDEVLRAGRLHLVDLAGSENIGRSGAVHQRAREAGNINQSLLALGKVINSLVEHQPYVPYRDSKLTRLLQESLGGKNKTCVIATIGPAASSLEESISTLEYAFRAKSIRNRPTVNALSSKRELLQESNRKLARLEKELLANRERQGVYLPLDTHTGMLREAQLMRDSLSYQKETIRDHEDTIKKTNAELSETVDALNCTRAQLRGSDAELCAERGRHSDTQRALGEARQLALERGELLRAQVDTEARLSAQASTLKEQLQEALAQLDTLHRRHESRAEAQSTNDEALRAQRSASARSQAEVEERLEGCRGRQLSSLNGAQLESEALGAALRHRAARAAARSAALRDGAVARGGEVHTLLTASRQECEERADRMQKALHALAEEVRDAQGRLRDELSAGAELVDGGVADAGTQARSVESALDAFNREHAQLLRAFAEKHNADAEAAAAAAEKRAATEAARVEASAGDAVQRVESVVVNTRARNAHGLHTLTQLLDSFVLESEQHSAAQQNELGAELDRVEQAATVLAEGVAGGVVDTQEHCRELRRQLEASMAQHEGGAQELGEQLRRCHAGVRAEEKQKRDALSTASEKLSGPLQGVHEKVLKLAEGERGASDATQSSQRELLEALAEERGVASRRSGDVLAALRRDVQRVLERVRQRDEGGAERGAALHAEVTKQCTLLDDELRHFVDDGLRADRSSGATPLRKRESVLAATATPPRVKSNEELLHGFANRAKASTPKRSPLHQRVVNA